MLGTQGMSNMGQLLPHVGIKRPGGGGLRCAVWLDLWPKTLKTTARQGGGRCIKPFSSSVFRFLPLAQTNLKPVARGVCTMETIEVMLQHRAGQQRVKERSEGKRENGRHREYLYFIFLRLKSHVCEYYGTRQMKSLFFLCVSFHHWVSLENFMKN